MGDCTANNLRAAASAVSAAAVISASGHAARSADPVKPKPELPKAATVRAERAIVAPTAEPPILASAFSARASRFAMLAGAVTVAAALGSLAGALAASGFVRSALPVPAVVATAPHDTRTVQTALEQMRSELAALRTGVEVGTRNTNSQFGKITERFDRVERAQAERSAKLAKATEALEKLERRADAPTKEITGSIPAQPVASAPAAVPAAAPAAAAHAPAPPAQPQPVPGWSVRDVYRGIALLQSARTGMMEVEAGDTVPYLGRIESIRRHEGRWVVVTSKGVITSTR
jgi:hypothetical protein